MRVDTHDTRIAVRIHNFSLHKHTRRVKPLHEYRRTKSAIRIRPVPSYATSVSAYPSTGIQDVSTRIRLFELTNGRGLQRGYSSQLTGRALNPLASDPLRLSEYPLDPRVCERDPGPSYSAKSKMKDRLVSAVCTGKPFDFGV
eukprot:1529743-Rhodomonas_salina.2